MKKVTLIDLNYHELRLQVAPELGGRISRLDALHEGGVRHLFVPIELPDPTIADYEQRVAAAIGYGGCYPLVPFSNRIARGRFSTQRNQVQLPTEGLGFPHAIHGVGCFEAWRVQDLTQASITLSLTYTRTMWPWRFHAEQIITLGDAGMRAQLSVRNDSDEPMPCGLGFHPYFARPPGTRLLTQTATHWQIDEDRIPFGSEPAAGRHNFSQNAPIPVGLDDGYSGWSRCATLSFSSWGIEVQASELFDHLILYTPHHKAVCAIEPVSHRTNAANLPLDQQLEAGWRYLLPGDTLTGTMQIRLK